MKCHYERELKSRKKECVKVHGLSPDRPGCAALVRVRQLRNVFGDPRRGSFEAVAGIAHIHAFFLRRGAAFGPWRPSESPISTPLARVAKFCVMTWAAFMLISRCLRIALRTGSPNRSSITST